MKKLLYLFFLLSYPLWIYGDNISPYEYGYSNADTPIKRYNVLLKTHTAAVNNGVDVDYSNLPPIIDLEIPQNAKSIPLTQNNDFKGVTFNVLNKEKNIALFSKTKTVKAIRVEKDQIDKGDFRSIKELKKGNYLLIIKDSIPWVEKRKGYNYGAIRKDILVLHNGKSENSVIFSYKNSNPLCTFCSIEDHEELLIKNLHFKRKAESTKITYLLDINNHYGIVIDNISINTPTSTLYGDNAITINNSANIHVKNVKIDGTYSLNNKYGYGINMDNVCKGTFENLVADANWGIFGNNNLNDIKLYNCDINRFDIHCYGKNLKCIKTTFRNLYNQFSSFYGTLSYEQCVFHNFTPVLLEPSYNAYTFFQISIKDCKWYVSSNRNNLVNAGYLGDHDNTRPELKQKYLPNIQIKDFVIYIPTNVNAIYLFKPNSISNKNKIMLSKIDINGLKFKYDNGHTGARLYTSSKDFILKGKLSYRLKNINLISGLNNKMIDNTIQLMNTTQK